MNVTRTLIRLMAVRLVCLAAIAIASISGIYRISAADKDSNVIAVGVLLEPEVAMVRYAQAANADLRRNYPEGYRLESAYCPRITLVQRFVRVSDLPAIIETVATVLDQERGTTLQLTTNGYEYETRNPTGLGVMFLNVEASPRIRVFEERIVEAIQPFAVRGGTADAFARSESGPRVNRETIDWVEYFVPAFSGRNFAPQLPVGVARTEYLEALTARPFLPLTFGVTGVAIYQLGAFGTAQERLWDSGGVDPCLCPFPEPDADLVSD